MSERGSIAREQAWRPRTGKLLTPTVMASAAANDSPQTART
jgi:hypothetical protein